MTAQIIDFRPGGVTIVKGNGALEAFLDIALGFNNTSKEDAAMWSDFMLAELWTRGFKVVPVE